MRNYSKSNLCMPLCEWAWLCNLSAPDSDASTVPASAEEVQKVAKQRYEASRKDQAAPMTPMNAIKKSNSEVDNASQPKLSRCIQSKQILGTDAEAKPVATPPEAKSTAVKAKAAPKKQVKDETEKANSPDTAQTDAIRECLRRSSTDNLQTTPSRPSPAPSASASTASPATATPATSTPSTATPSTATPSSGANATGQGAPTELAKQPKQTKPTKQSSAPGDDDPDDSSDDSVEIERLARIAKAKREAHERYMRFSRSLTSS